MIPDDQPEQLKELNLTYLEWCVIKPISPLVMKSIIYIESYIVLIIKNYENFSRCTSIVEKAGWDAYVEML